MRYSIFFQAVVVSSLLLVGGAMMAWLPAQGCADVQRIVLTSRDILQSPVDQPARFMAKRFSAAETLNVYVNIIFRPARDLRVVSLEFITPQGRRYETQTVPVAFDDQAPRKIELEGYRFPVPSRRAVPPPPGIDDLLNRVVSVPFAVGGTYISKNSLYGRWKINVYEEGQQSPCLTHTFEIEE